MLQEYALEPSLLCSWSDFRFFVEQFGVERGRLIARYPKRWTRLVYESLTDCKPVERKRIEEALNRLKHQLIPRQSDWDPQRDWLSNSEIEHSARPFYAIVAASNSRSHPAVIVGDTIDVTLDLSSLPEDDPLRLWKASTFKTIRRDAKAMADAIDALVKRAETIHFVDKYFSPERSRHRVPFEEFLSRISGRESSTASISVTYNCRAQGSGILDYFQSQCESRLGQVIPAGMKVEFHRWEEEDLHNRYVLTELGGIAFLEGLDQYDGKGRLEDNIAIIPGDESRQLIRDFTPAESRLRHVDECVVTGSKPVSHHKDLR